MSAALIPFAGDDLRPRKTSAWKEIDSAPLKGPVLLLLGETIPDMPDVRVGSWISEAVAARLGEFVSARGGWLIWNTDDDWFIVPFSDAHSWTEMPA